MPGRGMREQQVFTAICTASPCQADCCSWLQEQSQHPAFQHTQPQHLALLRAPVLQAASAWELQLQHLHSHLTGHSSPQPCKKMRPASTTARLFLLTPLQSSLMANPPLLLWQEPVLQTAPSPVAPLPLLKPVCSRWRGAGRCLSRADSEESLPGWYRTISVFRVFFPIVKSTGVQALLHSTAFKNLGAILLFVPAAE